jgi:hypothetical protein
MMRSAHQCGVDETPATVLESGKTTTAAREHSSARCRIQAASFASPFASSALRWPSSVDENVQLDFNKG